VNRNASAFTDLSSASLERRDTTIYEVIDLNAGQPVYVGKTFQQGFGEEGIQTRLDQHESLKPEWKGADYEIREIKSGTCTNFETATREMRDASNDGAWWALKSQPSLGAAEHYSEYHFQELSKIRSSAFEP